MRDRIPRRHHEEVLLGAGLHPVDDALRLGLIDRISESAEADARKTLESLSALPRHAYRAMKLDLREAVKATPEEEANFAAHAIPAWTSPEFKAKIAALLKR